MLRGLGQRQQRYRGKLEVWDWWMDRWENCNERGNERKMYGQRWGEEEEKIRHKSSFVPQWSVMSGCTILAAAAMIKSGSYGYGRNNKYIVVSARMFLKCVTLNYDEILTPSSAFNTNYWILCTATKKQNYEISHHCIRWQTGSKCAEKTHNNKA